jgi:hypothetical protein
MPIVAGSVRFRKRQVGTQAAFSSNTGATRILPYRGPITIEPNRTTPDVDTGSLDPVLPSFLGPQDIASSWEGKAAFDDLPYLYGSGIKGGVTPTGGATGRIWTYQAASLTADDLDYLTEQWGDDVPGDLITAGGGVIDSWSLGFGEDLAAFDLSASLVHARAAFGLGATGGLTIDTGPEWLYGAHTVIYMDAAPGSIGMTPIASAVHTASFEVANNLDKKRFADGSNIGFALAGYGRGAREITFTMQLAKTAAAIAEELTLDDSPVPTRYFDIKTTSTEIIAGGATPYSNSIRFPAELVTAVPGEIGGNTTIEFTYRAKYDPTLGFALKAVVVNTLATK